MKKLFQLDFLPVSTDLGLLLLRVFFGVSMLWLHGRGKAVNFSTMSATFGDPIGIGPTPSLVLAIFGEFVCASLVVLGLFTRFAAIGTAITMGVAFFLVHNRQLSGPGSGEMSFLYLGVFVTLLLTGAGRYSLDAKMGAKV